MSTAEAASATAPTTSAPSVEEQLCFALHSASRAMTACYRRELEDLGLTYSQYLVMLVLWEHGPISMGSLCTRLHLDSGTLSPMLKRLEKQGRITRRRRPEDERTLEIDCTDEGRALAVHGPSVQEGILRATGLSMDTLASLRDSLTDLAERLRAHAGEAAVDEAEGDRAPGACEIDRS